MGSRLWRMVAIGGVAAVVIAGCGSRASDNDDSNQGSQKDSASPAPTTNVDLDNGMARIRFQLPTGWSQTTVDKSTVTYSNGKSAELTINIADSPAFRAEKDPQRRVVLAIPPRTQALPQACQLEQSRPQIPGSAGSLLVRFENPCGTAGKRALDALVDNQNNQQPITDIATPDKVMTGTFIFLTESHNQVASIQILSKKTEVPESQLRDIENSLRIESLTNIGRPVAGAILPQVKVQIGHALPVPPADPCATLTRDGVAKINPVASQKRTDSASGKGDTCSYQLTDTSFIDYKVYSESLTDVLKKYLPKDDVTGTGKIGEIAGNTTYSWRSSGTQLQTLWALDNQHTALISISAPPGTLNAAMDTRITAAFHAIEGQLTTH